MNVRRSLGALLVGLGLTASPGSGSAQVEPDGDARAARLITLAVAAHTDEDVTQMVSHLRPLLEMRGLQLVVRRVDSLRSAHTDRSGAQPVVRARVWLDLKTMGRAEVLFAAGDQPPSARMVPTAARFDDVAAAEIAEIVLAAVIAPQGGLAAPSGERPPQLAAAAPQEEPGAWQRSLGILAAAQSWSRDAAAVPEVGLSVLLDWRPAAAGWSRAIWSSLRYRLPFRPAQSPVQLRVRGGEGEVLAVLAHGLGPRGRLGLALGLGLDVRLADPAPQSGTMLVDQQSVRELDVFLRTALRFDHPLGGPVSVFAALTLDLVPLQGRLVVRQAGADRAVFTPWPLRPGALAGVSLVF